MLVASTEIKEGRVDVRSRFSNYGVGIDIAAPGSDVVSTIPGGRYAAKSGTSMASPNAAAVAALIWSQNPSWDMYQVASALRASTDIIDSVNDTQYRGLLGAGRVNSLKSLSYLSRPVVLQSTARVDRFRVGRVLLKLKVKGVLDAAFVNEGVGFYVQSAGEDKDFGSIDDKLLPLKPSKAYSYGTNEIQFNLASLRPGKYQLVGFQISYLTHLVWLLMEMETLLLETTLFMSLE